MLRPTARQPNPCVGLDEAAGVPDGGGGLGRGGPEDRDLVCSEHRTINGFAHTDLDLLLGQHGVENSILAGMTAPGCVEGTGRGAVELGYTVTLLRDATAACSPELLQAAHEHTGALWANATITTDELIAALPASIVERNRR